MKIVTWNVNSLKARAERVARYLDLARPDVLCLQELKLEADKVPRELFEARGYHLAIHGQRQWNGVLVASRTPLTDIERGLPEADEGQARLVAATTAGLRLVNVYAPQGQAVDSDKFPYKLRFFAALRAWLDAHRRPDEPLVLLGDLNIAPGPEDVWSVEEVAGTPSYHPLEHERWAQLMAFGLTDVVRPHAPAGTFSFWDYRGAAFRMNLGMRIDHVLATAPVAARVRTAWVDRDERKKVGELKPSDHAPVGIELGR